MIVLLLTATALAGAVWWLRGQWAIDRCLDAGGRWNAEASACERGEGGGDGG